MIYYKIKNSIGNEIGKDYPQIQEMSSDYRYNVESSVWNIKFNEIPNFEPNFYSFVLHKTALLTDCLSKAPLSSGFIISDKVYNIIKEFNCTDYIDYPVGIEFKGENIFGYHWINFWKQNYEEVIFSGSEFKLVPYFGDTVRIRINSLSEHNHIIQMKDVTDKIVGEKILLSSEMKKFDIFTIGGFDSGVYVSENVKNILNENNITGFRFEPVENLFFE